MSHRTTRIVYWAFTLLFVIPQVWSATQMLTQAPRMTETISALGYPSYFMTILGAAKLLGAAAILFSPFRMLKEWAYAGYTFDVLGAFFSHVAHGDSALICSVPALFLVAQVCSYVAWKRLAYLKAPPISRRASEHSQPAGEWAMRGV